MTDLEPLADEPGVRVVYLPLDSDLDGVDAVVIPGTKNTVDDLLAIQEADFDEQLQAFDGPIVGLCGGYQLLGERIHDADIESATDSTDSTLSGIGLLAVETTFNEDKQVVDTTVDIAGSGPLAGATGSVSGYEIHMGTTRSTGPVETPFSRDGESTAALGARQDDVIGCYLHGLFENEKARDAFVDSVFTTAGRQRPSNVGGDYSPYDRAATLLADHCSLDWVA